MNPFKNKPIVKTELEDYIIEKQTSKSKFGITFIGYHKKTNKKVVIKKLYEKPSKSIIDNVLRINQINSKFFPQSQYINTPNDENFIIREYHEGTDLKTILKNPFKYSRLSETFVVGLFIEIFKALHILHNQNLLHSDIKPSNIIIKHKGNISIKQLNTNDFVLIDFERALALPTTINNKGFSLVYSPPEQILKYNELFTSSVDVFATCITLFEALTHKKPLYDCNAEIMINLQLTYPIPKPPKFNDELFDILNKGFYKERFPRPPRLLSHTQVNEILKKGIANRNNNAIDIAQKLQQWLNNHPQKQEHWLIRLSKKIWSSN